MKKIFLLIIILIVTNLYSQIELVPVSNPVYDFLKRMSLNDVISDYNSASLPLSRMKVANYLKEINASKSSISSLDKEILKDYYVEFSFDINKNLKNSYSFFSDIKSFNIFDNNKQKYLYNYADDNVSFFWDGTAAVYQMNSKGDSAGTNQITLGELGTRVRGTFFNTVGFYLRMSNGQKIKGEKKDIDFAASVSPKLRANTKFVYENKNFDTYEGYLRYATENEWFALTAGKEVITYGFGYLDKLFLSTNSVPFSFIKMDLQYKALKYSFLYGTLKGDSLGADISSKNIATHRLDINLHKAFRLGFWESLIISDNPFNFGYLNPFNFLRASDNTTNGVQNTNDNNSLMGLDFEVKPIKNVAMQATLLVNNLNLANIFKKENAGEYNNNNRFGYQIGVMYGDVFKIPTLTTVLEYTRINPFVYSHQSNKSQYTHWTLPLGHKLQPNSDEIALRISGNIYKRLILALTYMHQRTANTFIISGDTIVENTGGNINRGDGSNLADTKFLSGNRVDKDIIKFDLSFQPIWQFYLDFTYQYIKYNLLYNSKKASDNYFFGTLRIDF